uniref:coiled-coil domain-containing protein 38-like isoform X2 n=1 Tax=Scatophagus argus TaxID=75038 RepID=UPI001ED814F6|nr:coiled-coil domain-containing protein 38-like isoform X2 [Scatophagus argus]
MSTVIGKKKEHQKKDLRKFVERNDDKKTKDRPGQVVEEKEKQESMKIPLHKKKNATLPKQSEKAGPCCVMSRIKQDHFKREGELELLATEREGAELEVCLVASRSEIRELDKDIAAKEQRVREFAIMFESENSKYEEFLKRIEKNSADARTHFENEHKSNREKDAVTEKLIDEIETIKSEITKNDEILNHYERLENVLFKLSPPEWQETQQAKVPSHRVSQDEHNQKPQKSTVSQGLESSPGRAREPTLSSAPRDPLFTNSTQDGDSSEYELVDKMTELMEQVLFLSKISSEVNEMVKDLQKKLKAKLKKMKEEEEKLELPIKDMKDRIDKEKKRAVGLKKKIELHHSIKTANLDATLDALDVKVTEVYRCCVNKQVTNIRLLEKVASVEYRMSLVLQQIESIPEGSLKQLRKIKDSERRSRLCEEKLRQQSERRIEMMQKCMQRYLGDRKKTSGRKLLPRSKPAEQKSKSPKVSDEDDNTAEDEFHACLFSMDVNTM